MNIEDTYQEFQELTIPIEFYLSDTMSIVEQSNEPLEGNSFYYHNTTNRFHELLNKQVNLFWSGKHAVNRICEIGFNAGHSSFLLLIGNKDKNIEYTIFDICDHKYTRPCFEYLKSNFSNTNFEFIEGDSTQEVPKWILQNSDKTSTFDVVHVDGGHTEHCILNDLKNAIQLVKVGGLVIIDDTNIPYISNLVDKYISEGIFEEIKILPTIGYEHRIVKRIT